MLLSKFVGQQIIIFGFMKKSSSDQILYHRILLLIKIYKNTMNKYIIKQL